MIRPLILAALSLSIVGPSPVAAADKKYGPGVSDTEIRIGQTAPYSGPLSSLSRFGRIEAAYLNMKQWAPNDDIEESIFPYATAQMIVEVLKKCGDDLSRENLIRQATSVQGLQLPTFLPGLTINITPSSRIGWTKARMARFNGTRWVLLDDFVGN